MTGKDKQLTVRMPEVDIERIAFFVEKGYAINTADFIRRAIREKCDDLEPPKAKKQAVFGSG